MARLDGKRVLITGASSGIGRSAAELFAKEGADVALLARGREGLEVAARAARRRGARALVLPCDVTDREGLADAVARIEEELGGLDVVVPNAAATMFGPFDEVSPEEFDRVMEITFGGVVNTVRATLPLLERSRGTIVATGSLMARLPLPTFSSYAAAKHAMRGFLNSLRAELRAQGKGVKVAIVHPGSVNTPVWDNASTATGKLPRHPPEGYHPSVMAGAIVELAVHPRPEMTIGAETKVLQLIYDLARPLGELLFVAVHKYYSSGTTPEVERKVLWESVGDGVESDGMLGRPSLTAPLRFLLRR